jgi:hypothetical protein
VSDVVDHAVASVHAEVDVEVRHRHAFGIEEAFEQQAVAQRIEIGDAERVGDQRTGAGAAARADRACLRRLVATAEQQAADVAVVAGQRDQSGIRVIELAGVDQRVIAVAVLGVGARQQAREIEIAGVVLAQHGQALRFAALVGVGDPQVAARDRFDPPRLPPPCRT